jgi:hypothetical protein
VSAFLLFLWIGPGWPEPPPPRSLNCLSGATFDQRQKCDEEALGQAQKSQTTQLDGGWRLVRTRNQSGGADAVSVMHVADTAKSDTGLAGLSLQCGRDGIEVVLIVLERLSRTARPSVTLTAGINRVEFEASVVQGGEVLLLPQGCLEPCGCSVALHSITCREIALPDERICGKISCFFRWNMER